ncbi:MAG: hypothetical protein ACREPW_02315, partial [Candidatus Binataceae bacterium]
VADECVVFDSKRHQFILDLNLLRTTLAYSVMLAIMRHAWLATARGVALWTPETQAGKLK